MKRRRPLMSNALWRFEWPPRERLPVDASHWWLFEHPTHR